MGIRQMADGFYENKTEAQKGVIKPDLVSEFRSQKSGSYFHDASCVQQHVGV
jgi:hypothetical protein